MFTKSISRWIETFEKKDELNLDTISAYNPFLTVVLRDYNAKSSLWYKNDKATYDVSKIDDTAPHFGLHQLINEPALLTRNTSSCIDLIFSSQPNLVIESGAHSSLHENCHHQIIYAKPISKLIIHLHINGKFDSIKIETSKILEKQ